MNTRTSKILALFVFAAVAPIYAAEIEGPESISTGRIITFTADTEGDVILFPAEHTDLVKDTDKKHFYISTNIPGKYTLVFFAVEDGKPALCQRVFEVKALPKPEPEPEPKPEPEPEPELSDLEKEGLIYALQSVCYHIEKGSLKNPAGIRASFKTAIRQKILTETPALSAKLDVLTTKTDWTDAASIKKSFETFLAELGEPWKGADETFVSIGLDDLEYGSSKVKTTCPTGTCPPVKYYR